MSSEFFLFLPKQSEGSDNLDSVALSWVYKDINNELKLAQGLLDDAASAAVNHHVTLVLPGEDVLFVNAQVPGKNIHHVQQAVPYVLEDNVIDDVDNLYFAISKATINKMDDYNKYNVSIINKAYFESIVTQLNNAGVEADSMVADYLLLPEKTTLFFDGVRLLFNGSELKFSSNIDNVVNIESNSLADNEEIDLILCDKESSENNKLDKLISKANSQIIQCDLHPLLCLIKNSSADNTVNLLQGSYKKKKSWSQAGKTWLPAAVLFLIWLSVQGGLFIVDYISLSKQNKRLNAEITQIYKQAFPQSTRIIDAKTQMKQKLNDLKKRKGQSGRSFSEMLSGSASVFAKTKGLNIKTLRYYDGRINIELQIASLQALDELKNKLNTEKDYQVEIQNASSGKESVTARIQILGAEL